MNSKKSSLFIAIDEVITHLDGLPNSRPYETTQLYLTFDELAHFRELAIEVWTSAYMIGMLDFLPDPKLLKTRIPSALHSRHSIHFRSKLNLPGFMDAEHYYLKENMCEGIANSSLPPEASNGVFVVIADNWLYDIKIMGKCSLEFIDWL